jgi:hypothetical protein
MYWAGPGLGALDTVASFPSPAAAATIAEEGRRSAEDEQHVRSVNEVSGYHVAALDGEVGHVDDFLVDSSSWKIEGLLLDTSNWIGRMAVVSPTSSLTEVEWAR